MQDQVVGQKRAADSVFLDSLCNSGDYVRDITWNQDNGPFGFSSLTPTADQIIGHQSIDIMDSIVTNNDWSTQSYNSDNTTDPRNVWPQDISENCTRGEAAEMTNVTPKLDTPNTDDSFKLGQVNDIVEQIRARIEQIYADQREMQVPCMPNEYETMDRRQKEVCGAIDWSVREIGNLMESSLLFPSHLSRICCIKQDLVIFATKLNILQAELKYIREPSLSTYGCFAALVLIKQPFPKTLKKDTKSSSNIEDPISVQVIRGAKAELTADGPVKAELQFQDYQTKKEPFVIHNDTQNVDMDGIATFYELRFPSGTRLKMVRLQFTLRVQYIQMDGSFGKALLESELSEPFIVMTNENQWDQSAGALLKRDTFPGGAQEASWFAFANTLQIHYLKATRQDSEKPLRPLSLSDLSYIHTEKFGGKALITQKDFDTFWSWFSKILHRIRHQKVFFNMWTKGLLYGFISKPAAEQLLISHNPVTFILRFSDSFAGKVAIAYVKNIPNLVNNFAKVKHYLIEDEPKPLPDILQSRAKLHYIVQISTEFKPDEIVKGVYSKQVALRDLVSKKEQGGASTKCGYDQDDEDLD